MMNDSTRMDESLDEGSEGLEQKGLSPREAAMNAVIERQQQEQQEEASYLQSAKGVSGLPEDLPVYQGTSGDYVMRLKVDGAEQEMSLADIQATMQKHQAADSRLRQAAELKSQLESERHQFEQERQQYQALPKEGALSDDIRQQAQHIIDSLYDGDPEDAAEALALAMTGNRSSTISPELIRQEALNAMREQEYQTQLKSGFDRFQSEFSDIMADPDLRDLADRKTIELQSLHPDWSPEQILMESGRVIREKMGTPTQHDSRQARKAGIPTMPVRQSSSAYVPPGKSQPSNAPADVIGNMKRARGQF